MAQTSLPFYRKNQSLEDMEQERPKSMPALRQAVLNSADEVETTIKNLEREFTGGSTFELDIKGVLPAMKSMMDTFELTYINSSANIKTIIDYTLEPSEVFRFDMQAAERVKDYYRKIVDFLPEKFEEPLEDMSRILRHLKAYCLSFNPKTNSNSTKRRNPYLQTPLDYELKSWEFVEAIAMHLSNIRSMCRDYKSEAGLKVHSFGLASNELARRCDCGEMPLFLIFPEACSNIRNAIAGVRKWIQEDQVYVTYIKEDISLYETKRLEQEKRYRHVRDEAVQNEQISRKLTRDIEELEVEMGKLGKKEKQIQKKLDSLGMDIKIMEAEIKEKEAEREELPEKAMKMTDWSEEDLQAENLKIAEVIAHNRTKIPETKHKIEDIKHSRQRLIFDKRALLNDKYEEVKVMNKKMLMIKAKIFEAKTELQKIEQSIAVLKDIYLKKTSPDVTKKIFNSLPIQPRNAKHLPKRKMVAPLQRDPLDRATQVVARAIKDDWPKLYRSLPFYPERGEIDKDEDVGKVFTDKYRVDHAHKATESLDKWRRVNSLASVKTLKETLVKMNRKDIVEEVDRKTVKKVNTRKRAQKNWDKLSRFKATLGKIMTMQAAVEKRKEEELQKKLQGNREAKKVQFATKDMVKDSNNIVKKVAAQGQAMRTGRDQNDKTQSKWLLPKLQAPLAKA